MKKYLLTFATILFVLTALAVSFESSKYGEKDNAIESKTELLLPAEGIPEAEISKEELENLIKSARLENFIDAAGRFDEAKLKNFTNPVIVVVEKLKSKGYAENEIVEILKKYNMGYDPSGATWIGRAPTSEELKKLPPRTYPFMDLPPRNYPFKDVSLPEQRNAVMDVVYAQFRGVNNKMKPGSLAVKEGESLFHLVTTHVGRGGHWTEVGVIRSVYDYRWQFFTYDDDEGGYRFHGITTADTLNNYIIYVYPSSNGYKYNIWIDGNWVREGNLPYLENYVDQANEVWSSTGRFTQDTNRADHKEPFLYIGDSAIWWDTSVPTNWWGHAEVCEVHYMDALAWRFQSWVCV